MEQFLGNVKLTVTGIIVVAVALLLAVASCKGNGKDADDPVDESQLLFYEAYTNAEVGDAFVNMLTTAQADGDSVVIQYYMGEYESRPVVYHTEGDTTVVNNIVSKYGQNFLPDDIKLFWYVKQEYDFDMSSGSMVVTDTVNINYLYALKGMPRITAKAVASAKIESDPDNGDEYIRLVFTEQGAKQLSEMTTENLDRAIGVVYKGKLLCCPTIIEPINDGTLVFPNKLSPEETKQLLEQVNGQTN